MIIKKFSQSINENLNVDGDRIVITKGGMTYGMIGTLTGEESNGKFVDKNTFKNKFDYKVEFNNLKSKYDFAKNEFENYKNKLKSEGVSFEIDGNIFPDRDENIFN